MYLCVYNYNYLYNYNSTVVLLYNLEAATFLFIFFFCFSATNIASALFLKLNNVNTKSEAANNATDLGKDPFGCTRMQYVTSHVELFTSCI